jgi:Tol biopolymer transport system component
LPGIDERLRTELERLAKPIEDVGVFERIASKKGHRRMLRRFEVAALVAVVVAGTVAGTYGLTKVFRGPDSGGRRPATQFPVARNGKIAFLSDRDVGPGDSLIYSINPNGSESTRLTTDVMTGASLAWSPDGHSLAFARALSEAESEIDLVDADGTRRTVLAKLPPTYEVAWSPDGSKIAYSAGPASIYVMRLDGTGVTQLTDPPSPCGDEAPAWSPDGSHIAFRRFCSEQDLGIYSIDDDGADLRKLTSTRVRDSGPTWSPDGAKIAFGSAGQIYVMDAGGTNPTNLTADGENFFPAWSPDGTKIAFTSNRDGNREIYVMNSDGTEQTNITHDPAEDFAPAWQPVPPSGSASPSLVASPSPSVSVAPQDCSTRQSSATGDFDGDGTLETARVAPSYCFKQRTQKDAPWTLSIHFGNAGVEVGEWSMRECSKQMCQILGAGDLNGDGLDELAVIVEEGASTALIEFFPIHLDAVGPTPVVVVSPGEEGFPSGEAARFPYGGSVTHYAALGCGENDVISEVATLSADQTEWAVHVTNLHLDAAGPAPKFTVVSTDDSTQTFDPDVGVGDIFEPGGPCWTESPQR